MANTGLDYSVDNIINCWTTWNKLQGLVHDHALNTLLLTQHSITLSPYIFIPADKGNEKGDTNLA